MENKEISLSNIKYLKQESENVGEITRKRKSQIIKEELNLKKKKR
jgi:hypothetical protein